MDIPRSYITLAKRVLSFTSAKALPYDHTNFNILKFTASSNKWSNEKLVEYLQNRYQGHPEHATFLANRLIVAKQTDEAIKVLKSVINKDSSDWKSRILLVELLIKKSEYQEAEKIVSDYFKHNKETSYRVEKSKRAHIAGNRFYWKGRHKEAQKFYEISGSLATGSGSDYASLQRLGLMTHDYNTALEYAFKRGKRYNDRYGFRDYLAILHLIGKHTDAISGFTSLVSRYDSPPLWTSLFIGQRIQADEKPQYTKVVKKILSSTSEMLKTQAARYLFLSKVTDRLPTLDDLQHIPEVDPILALAPRFHSENIIKNLAIDTGIASFAKDCPKKTTTCIEEYHVHDKQMLKAKRNKYSKYLDAYVSYKNQDFKSAFTKYLTQNQSELILQIQPKYNQHGEFSSLLKADHRLPFFAISAAEIGHKEFLLALQESINTNTPDDESAFDLYLTESIILAASQQWDKSINKLKRAFNVRPHTKWRPMYSWYQITEIAEWLYQFSDDKRFLDLAIDWAKRYQVIQPQFGWAYAFEALYSNNREDQIRAAGFAYYLDRDSYWLSKVPEDVKTQGKQWWLTHNPFTLKQQDSQNKTSI
jgi:hypothetical protein